MPVTLLHFQAVRYLKTIPFYCDSVMLEIQGLYWGGGGAGTGHRWGDGHRSLIYIYAERWILV